MEEGSTQNTSCVTKSLASARAPMSNSQPFILGQAGVHRGAQAIPSVRLVCRGSVPQTAHPGVGSQDSWPTARQTKKQKSWVGQWPGSNQDVGQFCNEVETLNSIEIENITVRPKRVKRRAS